MTREPYRLSATIERASRHVIPSIAERIARACSTAYWAGVRDGMVAMQDSAQRNDAR